MALALGDKAHCAPTFVFLRHPWSRLCSALAMFWKDGETLADTYQRMQANYHLRPQQELIAPFKHRLDFIGIYERLDRDWQWVQETLGVGQLKPANTAQQKRRPRFFWREHDFSFTGNRYLRDFELCSEWQTS